MLIFNFVLPFQFKSGSPTLENVTLSCFPKGPAFTRGTLDDRRRAALEASQKPVGSRSKSPGTPWQPLQIATSRKD